MSTQPSQSRPPSPLRKKVVLVGDAACGKTSLLRSLCRQGFSPDYEPTTYDSQTVRFRTARSNDRRADDDDAASDEESPRPSLVEVTFSDTSGDAAYDRLRPLSYPDADLVLLCFAMTSPASMRSVSGRWAAEVRHHMPRVPVMLIGTKCDKLGAKESSSVEAGKDFVTNVEGRLLSRMVGAEEFLECSSALGGKHNRGVSKIRRRMLQMLQESGATRRWKKWAKMAVMMAGP